MRIIASMTPLRTAVSTLALALLASSCSRVDRQSGPPGGTTPTASPSPAAHEVTVEASILSAVVADDCQTADISDGVGKAKEKRALGESAKADAAEAACEQSRVQLLLRASAGDTPAHIELVSVRLNEAGSKRELSQLMARNPQQWSTPSNRYVPWDLTLSPGQELRTSFDLTAPNWTAIGGGNPWNTMGMHFTLSVTLRIDGHERAVDFQVTSPFLMREPNVKT